MNKWTAESGIYKFVIENKGEHFDLDVSYLTSTEYYWFPSLASAKRFVRKEYEGLNITRFKKV